LYHSSSRAPLETHLRAGHVAGLHDWRGVKTHMGINQEAYGAECAAIVRALDLAAERQRRWRRLDRVTIFTDAQAAIARMKSCKVGPGQQYTLRAREALAKIRAQSKYGGAQLGLRSPQRNRTATELNGCGTATSMDGGRRKYQHPWAISSGASVRRNGRRPVSGLSPESRTPHDLEAK